MRSTVETIGRQPGRCRPRAPSAAVPPAARSSTRTTARLGHRRPRCAGRRSPTSGRASSMPPPADRWLPLGTRVSGFSSSTSSTSDCANAAIVGGGESKIARRRRSRVTPGHRTPDARRVPSAEALSTTMHLVSGSPAGSAQRPQTARSMSARRVVGDDDDRQTRRGSGRHFAQASSTCSVRCAHSCHE